MAFTITRRANRVLYDLGNEFNIYTKKDFKYLFNDLRAAGEKSNRPSILQKLYKMFIACGVKPEVDREIEYYEELLKSLNIPDCFNTDLERKMMYAVYRRYVNYASPEDYMKRIVDHLEEKADGWGDDTLRLRILKRFIKYGDYLCAAGFTRSRSTIEDYVCSKINSEGAVQVDDVAKYVDDEIFNVLEDAATTKEMRKPDGAYGLLKVSDDIAKGKFRAGGQTKKNLYLFAMAYNMTFHKRDFESSIFIPESDIEKNLFVDYYSNNFARYLCDAYNSGNQGQYEQDPSGQGINFKNFAEMIYLYYISSDLSPSEKISCSSDMIRQVKEMGKDLEFVFSDDAKIGKTVYYNRLFCEDVLNYSEEDFKNFLLNNYNCNTRNQLGEMQIENEQGNAGKVFELLKDKLFDLRNERQIKGDESTDFDYGLFFVDMKSKSHETFDKNADEQKVEELYKLLEKVDKYLRSALKESAKKESKYVSRAAVLTVFYYYFNLLHEWDEYECKSFKELFDCFKQEADPYLQEALYSPVSGKNIFDVWLVFSSFAYFNV